MSPQVANAMRVTGRRTVRYCWRLLLDDRNYIWLALCFGEKRAWKNEKGA